MSINWSVLHWPTLADFERHLAMLPRPAWVKGLTTHHTWSPTVEEWRGRASMESLGRFYEQKGWSAGPQLFIGPDGIWQGTPISDMGVHAGPCNAYRLGIEVVGNYMAAPWAEPVRSLALGVHAALLRWLGLECNPFTVWGHRDCMPGQTSCPGDAIDMRQVRGDVAALLRAWAMADDDPQVLGLAPGQRQCTLPMWLRSWGRNGAPSRGLSADAQHHLYGQCIRLGVEPWLILAMAAVETQMGRSGAGPAHNWLNVREYSPERPHIEIDGRRFEAHGTPELGIERAILHLCSAYAYGFGLTHLNEVIAKWAPPIENDTAVYLAAVRDHRRFILAN